MVEMPNGHRRYVDEQQYMVDKFNPNFTQIIATDHLIIYRIACMGSRPAEKRSIRQGRSNRGMPWAGA